MVRKFVCWVSIFLSAAALTGCWDRQEINDVAFVLATALDIAEEGYRATIQVPLPSQIGGIGGRGGGGGTSGTKKWFLDSQVAKTIRNANEQQQRALSRELNFAHRRVIVVGEELARQGVHEIVDILARAPQNRLTAFMLVARGEAREVLNVEAPVEQTPAEMIRELAQSSMKHPRNLKWLLHNLHSAERDTVLPVISRTVTKPGGQGKASSIVQLDGLAVFRHDRLVGMLQQKQAEGVLWAMGQIITPTLTTKPPSGDGNVVIRFTETTTTMRPQFQGSQIIMHLEVRAHGSVVENVSDYEPLNTVATMTFEKQAGQMIAEHIRESVRVLQTQYRADPIGFGAAIQRTYPRYWQQIQNRWDEIYPTVQVHVDPVITLEHSGTFTAPLGKTPKEGLWQDN